MNLLLFLLFGVSGFCVFAFGFKWLEEAMSITEAIIIALFLGVVATIEIYLGPLGLILTLVVMVTMLATRYEFKISNAILMTVCALLLPGMLFFLLRSLVGLSH